MHKVEIYTLKQCPYCIRLKALLDSKDVAYEELLVDGQYSRQDMAKRTQGKMSVPQLLVDDQYLGGYDEVLDLEARGKLNAVLDIEADQQVPEIVWDVLIIGAGPAGLSAGIYAARKGLQCLVVAKEAGGQVADTSVVENYAGFTKITGPDMVDAFLQQARGCGVELLLGAEVVDIRLATGCKEVLLKDGTVLYSSVVIVASGAQKRKLDVPGEADLAGRGVGYCAICDGPEFAGKPVAVIGGGNSGLEAALSMTELGSSVALVERGDELRGDTVLRDAVLRDPQIQVYTSHTVKEIVGDQSVASIVLKNLENESEQTLQVEGVLVMIGLLPNSSFALELVSANDAGEIYVNEHNETGVPGVFATGDVTDIRYKQIIIAAGDGAKTALEAADYLRNKR